MLKQSCCMGFRNSIWEVWEVAKTMKNRLGFGFLNYMGRSLFSVPNGDHRASKRQAGMILQVIASFDLNPLGKKPRPVLRWYTPRHDVVNSAFLVYSC
jgi:hypothetical protein